MWGISIKYVRKYIELFNQFPGPFAALLALPSRAVRQRFEFCREALSMGS